MAGTEVIPAAAARSSSSWTLSAGAATIADEDDRSGILRRIRRHKYVAAGVFVLALGLVGAIYAVAPRSYQGRAEVMLATPEPLLGDVDSTIEAKQGDPADVASQVVVLASSNLLQRVAAEPAVAMLLNRECEARRSQPLGRLVDLVRPADCDQYKTDPVAGARYLYDRVDVSTDGQSRVIELIYNSPIAAASQLVPNAIADAFIAEKLQDRLDSRLAAVNWLRAEIARISTDLVKTEAEIEAFHREHGLVRGETSLLAEEELTEVGQQLTNARAAQSQAAAELGELRRGAGSAPATLNNQVIADIKQQLAIVAAAAADYDATRGPAYPWLIGLRQKQASLRTQLNYETARIGASLEQEYAAATAKVAALADQLKDARVEVAAQSDAATRIASLQRHAEVQRELFLDLSKKIDTLEIERRILTGNARVVGFAQYPDKIHFPRKLPFILGGLMLAAAASIGVTLLLDRGDATVRTKRGLERAAGIPMLGYIPAIRKATLASCRQVQRPGALQDAARRLFANCVLTQAAAPRTILISSALAGDGKTFVALALAVFAARSGRRVLAIEADLRRPDFSAALAVHSKRGLADYLRGDARCEEIVVPNALAGLDVIIAGRPTFDSTELISNGRVKDLLAWAQGRYDTVLIDGPPTEALVDARLLAREVDGVLFCARWGSSDPELVGEAVRGLAGDGARVLGLAINRVVIAQLRLYERRGRSAAGYRLQLS
jgi:polysaccharide biosynthesis transport protein